MMIKVKDGSSDYIKKGFSRNDFPVTIKGDDGVFVFVSHLKKVCGISLTDGIFVEYDDLDSFNEDVIQRGNDIEVDLEVVVKMKN